MFVIEKGIDIPQSESNRGVKFPFEQMEVGDSFSFFSTDDPNLLKKKRKNAHQILLNYKIKDSFAARIKDNTVRIWKVK